MTRVSVLILMLVTAHAHAQVQPTTTLRWATVAPEGTTWAREIHGFSVDLDAATSGALKMKWYFGGIAGSELEMKERLERGQLDGVASGGILCERLVPTLRVLRMQALFQSRDEAMYVLSALNDQLVDEARANGIVLVGTSVIGNDVILLKQPAGTFDALKKLRLWRWDVDEEGTRASREMGFQIVPLPLEKAGGAFDRGEIDGLIGIPSAILAFQWFARAHYLIDLKMGMLAGCVLMTSRAFDKLTREQQIALKTGAAKLRVRFSDAVRRQDEALLGGLFQKQGVTPMPVSETMRAAYFAAAKSTRHIIGDTLPPETMNKVNQLLADYRAEHRPR
jgi:TRAP-type C4-dicarboxylate transport system substrate-binding protein